MVLLPNNLEIDPELSALMPHQHPGKKRKQRGSDCGPDALLHVVMMSIFKFLLAGKFSSLPLYSTLPTFIGQKPF
jgi:hypothetical protein